MTKGKNFILAQKSYLETNLWRKLSILLQKFESYIEVVLFYGFFGQKCSDKIII